jgi:hypothetical protein
MTKSNAPRQDVYTRITDKIIADLEQGVRPWMKPWNAEHAAGRVTKPLRHNGQPYQGINILMLWSAAVALGYSALIWMTFRQARELGAQVRKGERGGLVVCANTLTRTEADGETGEEVEHAIPFMKGYTVFNVEQIEGLPGHYYQLAEPVLDPVQRIEHAESFFAAAGAEIRHGGNQAYYAIGMITSGCRPSRRSARLRATTPRSPMRRTTGRAIPHGWPAISGARSLATRAMPAKSWSPSSAAPSWPRTLAWSRARIIRPISPAGLTCCVMTSGRSSARPPMRSVLRIF